VVSNLKHFCNIKSLRKVLVKVDPAFERLAKILNDEEVEYKVLMELVAQYVGSPTRLDLKKEVLNYCIRRKVKCQHYFLSLESLSLEHLLLYIELLNKTGVDLPVGARSRYPLEEQPLTKAFPIWAIDEQIAGSRSKMKEIIKKCIFIESNTEVNYQKLNRLSRTWFIKKGSELRDEFIEKSVFHSQGSIMSEFITNSDAFEVLLSLAKSKQQTLMDKLLVHGGRCMEEWRYMQSKPYKKIKREHLENMYRNDQQFSKKVKICSTNLNLLIYFDFFDDKDLSKIEIVGFQAQGWGNFLEDCGFFDHFCEDNKNIKLARSPANLELINGLWKDSIQQISKNSGIKAYPIRSVDWFRFINKTKQNLLIGLSILEKKDFESFLKYISKAFVIKNDLKFLPLEKRKLIYNKFTKKIDDIFEEAHISKSLNLQINE